jgi:Uri superfamily endonuclease
MRHERGTYALVLFAKETRTIEVGRIGRMSVRPGFYVYVGSAFGPGGVIGRVSRHLRTPDRKHWHIDYLGGVAGVLEVWYSHDPIPREHEWARTLAAMPGSSVPLFGFGASDCTCCSHLYFFESRPSTIAFRRRLRSEVAHHAPVRCRAVGGAPSPLYGLREIGRG